MRYLPTLIQSVIFLGQVWRAFRKKKVELNVNHYNLLLRCVKTCGVGNESGLHNLIQHETSAKEGVGLSQCSSDQTNLHLVEWNKKKTISMVESLTEPSTLVMSTKTDVYGPITDILNHKLKIDSDLYIDNLNSATSRLILLGEVTHLSLLIPSASTYLMLRSIVYRNRVTVSGGVKGVLRRMQIHNCQPNIKTFFYLLSALPSTRQAEDHLLTIIKV